MAQKGSATFWYGELDFPPYQNNAIRPVLRYRKGGRLGASIASTPEVEFWYAKASKALASQHDGMHALFYEGELGIVLMLYPAEDRGDIDGPVKKALDALQMGLIVRNDKMFRTQITGFGGTDKENPRVEIHVWSLTGPLSEREEERLMDVILRAVRHPWSPERR